MAFIVRQLWLQLLLAIAALPAAVAVVNHQVDPSEVDVGLLRHALMGRTTVWTGGMPVVLVLSREGPDAAVIDAVTGRDLGRLLRGWKRLTFSGNGAMPLVVDHAGDRIRRVAERRGAVTLVAAVETGSLPPDVSVVPLDLP